MCRTTNQAFVTANLADGNFATMKLNVIAYLTNEGKPVWIGLYDQAAGKKVPVPASLLAALKGPQEPLHEVRGQQDRAQRPAAPARRLADGHDRAGDRHGGQEAGQGRAADGRWLDAAAQKQLADVTHLSLQFGAKPFDGKPGEVIHSPRT